VIMTDTVKGHIRLLQPFVVIISGHAALRV
jgi:hypothetical protein